MVLLRTRKSAPFSLWGTVAVVHAPAELSAIADAYDKHTDEILEHAADDPPVFIALRRPGIHMHSYPIVTDEVPA